MKTLVKTKKVHELAHDKFTAQMERICGLLGWTEEKYCQYQYTCYYVFLNQLFSGFPTEMRKEVEYSPIMSGYWKNEWYHRNELDFVPYAEDICNSSAYVDAQGRQVYYQPLDNAQDMAVDEFGYINDPRRLQDDDAFMAGYNRVLKLIVNANK